MKSYIIKGGKKLCGSVQISGCKNAVLPMIAASILTEQEVVIKNCPQILDVFYMSEILKDIGAKVEFCQKNLIINAKEIYSDKISKNLANKLRSSVIMMGALLSRCGRAGVYFPGGCDIGKRPVDMHINALKQLGANFLEKEDYFYCYTNGLVGNKITLPFPSVGATENIILTSILASGTTTLYNYAKEPEIFDFISFLNSMGAKIITTKTKLIIDGVEKLHGTAYQPIFDRIECGTFLVSAAITGGEVEIKGVKAENISSLITKLCDNTCKIAIKNDIIYITSGSRRKAFNISTGPYPAFPTDLQPITTALLSVSNGSSIVYENVFENRFNFVKQLCSLGANISVFGNKAIINGVKRLTGNRVVSQDLRGGAALVLAGLNADGITEVCGVEHIERGYENFCNKLRLLGADVKSIEN